ncbi:MAG: cupin domain-containing protein [Myxococcota bacterium]
MSDERSDPTPDHALMELYGVRFFDSECLNHCCANADHSYYFECFIGSQVVRVERGDCVYFFSPDKKTAHLRHGPCEIESEHCATVVRGFMPPDRSCSLEGLPVLPYVNGCATKQVFAPPRAGDPTLQYLRIPPYSSEQAHHIHSTARVVFILAGRGVSVVGMDQKTVRFDLEPGRVCIFDPMCPHHFETPYGEPLIAVPLHVFSSSSSLETMHPMYSGTHLMNHGSH